MAGSARTLSQGAWTSWVLMVAVAFLAAVTPARADPGSLSDAGNVLALLIGLVAALLVCLASLGYCARTNKWGDPSRYY